MTFQRREFLLATGTLLALLPHAGRAAGNSNQPAPSAPLVGAVLPLSGADALVGDECRRGVALAVDDINQEGGIARQPAGLAVSDAFGQDAAAAAARALIAGKHAGLLLGTGASGLSYPGSAAAELAQVPYIELNAPADGIAARGFKFLARTCITTSMIATVAAAAIAKRLPGKKIGLLFNTGATGGAVAAAVLAIWRSQNITPLLVVGYPELAADLHDSVGRLRRAGVEVLLHAAELDDVLQLFQAMQDFAWKPKAVFGCGDGYGMRETAYALGPAFEGVFVAAAPFYPARAAYIGGAYLAKYGSAPRSADSLSAYVGTKLVLDCLNEVGGDFTKLLDRLRSTSIPAGTLANGWGAQFDKTGQNTLSFATLQQWQGGSLVAAG
jgi:branched-chain amino acid transport system substrate-binding protein